MTMKTEGMVSPGAAAAASGKGSTRAGTVEQLSLEVRWIFPGQLEAAVAGWFGRFTARVESREDAYLLDPPLRGLSALRPQAPAEGHVEIASGLVKHTGTKVLPRGKALLGQPERVPGRLITSS